MLETITCTGTTDCDCIDCWVGGTKARWAKAYAEGRVAHVHTVPCKRPQCPDYREPVVWCGMAEVAS